MTDEADAKSVTS